MLSRKRPGVCILADYTYNSYTAMLSIKKDCISKLCFQKENPVLTHYHYNILKTYSGKSKNQKHTSLYGKFIPFFHFVNEIPEGEM